RDEGPAVEAGGQAVSGGDQGKLVMGNGELAELFSEAIIDRCREHQRKAYGENEGHGALIAWQERGDLPGRPYGYEQGEQRACHRHQHYPSPTTGRQIDLKCHCTLSVLSIAEDA